eukprot:TRINITY_DN1637_c0_g1_i1.p1 TRINITY_DN1637_c0_g1~~TRINITY_DN1637_c0_g1_i1.p1  ORF type:complete len:258 (+),score=41.60 TRINITY_DN1637_c0_g1_i1:86-775(+)
MNEDHSDSNVAYVRHYNKIDDAKTATFTSLDATGMNFDVTTTSGEKKQAHVPFKEPVTAADQLRPLLIAMSDEAFTALGIPIKPRGPPSSAESHGSSHGHGHGSHQSPKQSSKQIAFAAPLPVVLLILFGMFNLWSASHQHDAPVAILRPIRDLAFLIFKSQSNLLITWYIANSLHFLEAIWSQMICLQKGFTSPPVRLFWFIQTFLFGYASIGPLRSLPDTSSPKKHQ